MGLLVHCSCRDILNTVSSVPVWGRASYLTILGWSSISRICCSTEKLVSIPRVRLSYNLLALRITRGCLSTIPSPTRKSSDVEPSNADIVDIEE